MANFMFQVDVDDEDIRVTTAAILTSSSSSSSSSSVLMGCTDELNETKVMWLAAIQFWRIF